MKYAVVVKTKDDEFIVGYDELPTLAMLEELRQYYIDELHLVIFDIESYELTPIDIKI